MIRLLLNCKIISLNPRILQSFSVTPTVIVYSVAITGNLESSEESGLCRMGTNQASFDLAHRGLVEDLGDTHSQAHRSVHEGVQELLRIWRNHRRKDDHTADTGGNVESTL